MISDTSTLVAVLVATAIFLVALAHAIDGAANLVKAMGNLCSAVAHFVIRFRRLMRVIGRRIRRT